MNVHFYLFSGGAAESEPLAAARWWQPDRDGLPPRGFRTAVNYFWWGLSRFGGFSRDGFAEIRIHEQGRLLHRLIVTPRWYRFPFMAPDDLQVGTVWTSPAARRRGLAAAAIGEAHRRFANEGDRFWYVCAADNAVSGALARSCGYRLAATGRRTRRLGLSILGRYVIDRFIQRADTATEAIAPDCAEESPAGRSLSVSH